ncbi:hypothetical protein F7725_028773 [Dissostichus mawsoni]|uniref:Uncharacterized protein n=1 Tax=Dissostichus mawsoni TaxID=36200 RepID=A0A7J5XGL2_DISMA|nr:hypothetical protein F7725_028773 [Dissostichus mawsoni]
MGANMLAAEARAKAEAARTKAAYAKRQVDMEVEKARIDATLNALKEEGEAEAAAANTLNLKNIKRNLATSHWRNNLCNAPVKITKWVRQNTKNSKQLFLHCKHALNIQRPPTSSRALLTRLL